MTTEATVADVPAIIEHDANERTAQVAAAAAAQIDQATKDAEAIARAAQQTDLGGRIQSQHEENLTWRASMEARLTAERAEAAAEASALKASILEAISTKPLTPAVPEVPIVEAASVSGEQEPSSKPTVTTPEPTAKRRRVLL